VLPLALFLAGATVVAPILSLATASDVESRDMEDVEEKEVEKERRESEGRVENGSPSRPITRKATAVSHTTHLSRPFCAAKDAWSVPRRL
jgi:hypothetical protein